jgi:hypothetical protein
MPVIFPTGRVARHVATFLGLGLALSGCSLVSGDYDNVKCPATGVVGGIGNVSRFDGLGTGFADLAYRASLSETQSDCSVDKDGVTVTVTVSTIAELGPAAPGRTTDFPYFVAIADATDKIIAKQVFANPITFKPDRNRAGSRDTLSQRIALANPKDADRYHVVLGFQLTEDELAYNRTRH